MRNERRVIGSCNQNLMDIMGDIYEANGHKIDAIPFRKALITWGLEHFRPLPWRLTENPYNILMAEIMLHRTQANQVGPIYNNFIKKYPTLHLLAAGNRKDIKELLYPLGLHWRVNSLHQMVFKLMDLFEGIIPQDKSHLLSLPGVSEYIAGSVRCFAWNIAEPLVDTNTVRVIGRLFDLDFKESSRRNRVFRQLISALVDKENPRAYNYALLDLAGQICTKRKGANHNQCPILVWCKFGSKTI
ncbi:DNA-binding protein [bacterium]|nr:MAG: DNA-binding protein [bacterium]